MNKKHLHILTQPSTIALLLLMGCGTMIRIYGLSDWYWSPDDVFHLSYGFTDNVFETIRILLPTNVHPPLMFVLIHYLVGLTDNPLLLRSISLVPGIVLIPLSYQLGKEYKGTAAGLFMAFTVTFASKFILLSQPIRQYMILACLITFATTMLLRFERTSQHRYLVGYFIAMLLALYTHFAAAITIFALGISFGIHFLITTHRIRRIVRWSAVHLLLAAACLIFVGLQTSISHTSPEHVLFAAENWLSNGFFKPSEWFLLPFIILSMSVITFISVSQGIGFIVLLILALFGWILNIHKRDIRIVGTILIALTVNILLSFVKIYPFDDLRHSFYLVPILLLIPASAFAYGCQTLAKIPLHMKLNPWQNKHIDLFSAIIIHFLKKLPKHYRPLTQYTPIVAFILMVGFGLSYSINNDFFRHDDRANFPTTHTAYTEFIQAIDKQIPKEAIIVSERKLLFYCLYDTKKNIEDLITYNKTTQDTHILRLYSCWDRQINYFDINPANIAFFNIHSLQHYLLTLKSAYPEITQHPIWFISTGWREILYKLAVPEYIEEHMHRQRVILKYRPLATLYNEALKTLGYQFSEHAVHTQYLSDSPNQEQLFFKTDWPSLEKTLLSFEALETFQLLNTTR